MSGLSDYDPDQYAADTQLDLNPMNYANMGNDTWESVPLAQLARRPQREQMRFADAIARRYAKNPAFLQRQLAQLQLPLRSDGWNETSLGNLAFIAYHNPNTVWEQIYQQALQAAQPSCCIL